MAETKAPGILAGKRGLIMGVANNRSIAWGIAQAARQHGAELAFTYQGDALKKRVEPLAKELDAAVVGHCDVTDGATIDAVFEEVRRLWGSIDFVVHCIAFSDKDELTGRYVETSEGNFTKSLLISCYSFTAIAQRAEKLMNEGVDTPATIDSMEPTGATDTPGGAENVITATTTDGRMPRTRFRSTSSAWSPGSTRTIDG